MKVVLTITAGPHVGKEFVFGGHDTLLVGRSKEAHLQFSYDDPYFSRRHFLVEVHPPRVRILDLNSRNGVQVNGRRVECAELREGDEITAGHTVFKVRSLPADPDEQPTHDLTEPPTKPMPVTASHHPSGWAPPGYRIEERVGEGAMGVVYRGVRARDGAPVAVKVIKTADAVNSRQRGLFLREANILGLLDHDHIVGHLGSGDAGGRAFLVMEWIDGPSLDAVVNERGPMEVRRAVRVACQILSALKHAHATGFVHRDVKPGNVLLAPVKEAGKRVAKVADFGLARAYDESQLRGLTMQGEVGGTPAYMAPEQVTHYRDVRPAADQYSTAATLYRLLTGAQVYDFPHDVQQQLVLITTKPPIPIQNRRAGLPPNLAAVVMRGLARDPAERFADVAAFRAALHPFT